MSVPPELVRRELRGPSLAFVQTSSPSFNVSPIHGWRHSKEDLLRSRNTQLEQKFMREHITLIRGLTQRSGSKHGSCVLA